MKKILFLTGFYGQRGSVFSMLTLIKELKLKGYSISLIIGKHGTAENIEQEYGVQSQYIKSYNWTVPLVKRKEFIVRIKDCIKKFLNVWSEIRLYKYLKSFKPDIVVINSSSQYVGIKSCNKLGIPVIMYFREFMTEDHAIGYWSEKMAKKYFSMLDGGIAISQDIQKYFQKYSIKNLKVIYNGIDIKKYDVVKERQVTSTFNITCVGSLCQGKNQMLALKAAHLLVEDGVYNFHIYFYGNDKNEYSDGLREYIKMQNLTDYVTFEGMVNDIEQIYGKAQLNLLCSKREAFGRVIIEGMLNHCLSIVANCGGAAEIIEDRQNGLLFISNDEQSLCQILKYAMDNYENLIDIIKRGYDDAKNRFSSKENTKNVEEFLKEICGNS